MADKPILTDEEFGVALANLTAQGLIEWGGDEELWLTDKGIDCGLELKNKLGSSNWVLLTLLHERIRDIISEKPQ